MFIQCIQVCFYLSVIVVSTHIFAKERIIDDSYTPTERFARYIKQDPTLVRPTLSFDDGQKIIFNRRYKEINGRDLHLDIFLPVKQRASGQSIMLVHGGGWRAGDKSHFYPMANLLAKRGFVVILPEYRLSIEAQYPAGLVDLNHARIWLAEHGDEFSIDPNHIAIGGGSSGGHMAALVANTANKPWFKGSDVAEPTTFNAVIDLDGVLDFTTPLAIKNENKNKEKSAVGLWFGGSMQDRLSNWQQASTAKHIHKDSPPILIISSGQSRFTTGKDDVVNQLNKFGIPNQYYELKQVIHTFWLFEPYLSQTVDMVDLFFKKLDL
jgi:pectinesterase